MKKRKLRIILMIMLITVFTTTSVFAINTANFYPSKSAQPITGAGKRLYEDTRDVGGKGYFSKWDSKSGSIIPATATDEKPGIHEKYTDQAKRAPGAYSSVLRGSSIGGITYYGLAHKEPIYTVKSGWYNFITDNNSGGAIQVQYYHNIIYDPTDTKADNTIEGIIYRKRFTVSWKTIGAFFSFFVRESLINSFNT